MVKESTIALGLTALGVAFTGVIALTLARQGPTPGVAQAQPQPIRNRQASQSPPAYSTESESQLAAVKWTDVHRRQAAMFGRNLSSGGSGVPGYGPKGPSALAKGPELIGGLQGFNNAVSGSQTQFQPAGSNPLYTGTRYGPLLGLTAGPRFQNEGSVPIY